MADEPIRIESTEAKKTRAWFPDGTEAQIEAEISGGINNVGREVRSFLLKPTPLFLQENNINKEEQNNAPNISGLIRYDCIVDDFTHNKNSVVPVILFDKTYRGVSGAFSKTEMKKRYETKLTSEQGHSATLKLENAKLIKRNQERANKEYTMEEQIQAMADLLILKLVESGYFIKKE